MAIVTKDTSDQAINDAAHAANPELDWYRIRERLTNIVDKHLNQGNHGAERLVTKFKPLWNRYWAGERTQDLHDAIMRYTV